MASCHSCRAVTTTATCPGCARVTCSNCTAPYAGKCGPCSRKPARASWRETYRQEKLTCPTCKRPTLTPWEKARGYQCRDCTAHDES